MSVLSRDVPAAPTRGNRRAAPVGRRAAADATVRLLATSALWLSLLLVTYWWDADGGIRDLGGWVTGLDSLGRLTGLVASVLLLAQVVLMARVPRLEAAYGQDRLAHLHRLVGFTSFNLLLTHIVLITWGYAAGQLSQTPATLWNLVVSYPGMLLATGGTVCLFLVVVTSIKAARRRIRYESWHLLHLYAYVGVGLALPHQLWTGQQFLSSPGRTFFWWTAWAVAAGSVLVWRVGLPVWRNLWHRLEVTSVVRETDDVVSVYLTGRRLHRLRVEAGQFFTWRFLGRPGWTRANPYSLSAAPDGRSLRITAAHVGDGAARLATLRPGTRVLVEGPYGRLHAGVRTRSKVLLMGAGIGITPLRALLEGLEPSADVVVVHRASDGDGLVLSRELAALAQDRGARYVTVPGPRVRGRASWLPQAAAQLTDPQALAQLVPDVAERDVFLCGAPGWMDAARAAVLQCGVPEEQVHLERFTY